MARGCKVIQIEEPAIHAVAAADPKSPELDFLVDTALGIEGVYGSRMTGGGFGGCTVTMLRPDAAERFRGAIARAYQERFGVTPQMYDCRPSKGASEVTDFAEVPGGA